MKNFTQKALMVVLTLFVLVGLFYGFSTPIKASSAAGAKVNMTPGVAPGPFPCDPDQICSNQ